MIITKISLDELQKYIPLILKKLPILHHAKSFLHNYTFLVRQVHNLALSY